MPVDYELKSTETVVGCSTDYAVRRLKTICRYSTCLRLTRTVETGVNEYFIVESSKVAQLERVNGIYEKRMLDPSMFDSVSDETVYRRRKAPAQRNEKSLFDN